MSTKSFEPRESLFTTLYRENVHVQSIINIMAAAFLYLGLAFAVEFETRYWLDPNGSESYQTYNFLKGMLTSVTCWLLPLLVTINLSVFAIYLVVRWRYEVQKNRLKAWIVRKIKSDSFTQDSDDQQDERLNKLYEQTVQECTRFGDRISLVAYGAIQVFVFVYTPYYSLKHQLFQVYSIFSTAETCRIMMKIHSYYVEKHEIKLERESFLKIVQTLKRNENEPIDKLLDQSRPKLGQLAYYWVAPTLIYKDQYPRNDRIKWANVASYAVQLVASVIVTYYMGTRLMLPEVQYVGLVPYQLSDLGRTIRRLTLFGFLGFGLVFYSYWHLGNNLSGELLRFADRQMYHAWWTSYSQRDYYRKWNLVVKEWLVIYIFYPVLELTGKQGFASFSVMFVSAIFHEYILIYGAGVLFPISFLGITFFGVQVWLTNNKPKGAEPKDGPKMYEIVLDSNLPNVGFHLAWILGTGLTVYIYALEYFASINCPVENPSFFYKVFVPKTLFCMQIQWRDQIYHF